MPDRKLRVFLCHSSQDKPIVRELYKRLSAEDWIDPWLDEEKLLPGHDWDMEIEKAVESADVVIVCLSTNSVSKEGYVQKELRFVLNISDEKPEGTIFVIPLRLDNCQVPRRIKNWQYVDYFPEGQKDITYGRLTESLKLRRPKVDYFDVKYDRLYRDELASRRDKAVEIVKQKGVIDKVSDIADPLSISNRIARRLLESLVNQGVINGKYRPSGVRIYFIENEIGIIDEIKQFFEELVLPRFNCSANLEINTKVDLLEAPNRILLVGPPGIGKTVIAYSIGFECKDTPFFRVTVADIFTKFGNSAEKIKESFTLWRKNAPCIVFIDEVESIAARPSEGEMPNPALLQFLHEVTVATDLDKQILIICATNNFDLLDPAFVQLFFKLDVGLPDSEALNKLAEKYFPERVLSKELSRDVLVSLLINRTPRDIFNCSADCKVQRWTTHSQKVTVKMVNDWLKRNPINKKKTSNA